MALRCRAIGESGRVKLVTILADNEAFRRALTALQAGNLRDAERLFKTTLRGQPKHLGALNLLGVVLTRLGRFAEAETYLRYALQENASSDATLYNYGIVLKALNRPAEALERFTQALTINSTVADTWNNRGTIFNDLNRFDEAVADFDRAIQLNPGYAGAFCNKGKALIMLKRANEALSAFDGALALKPDLAEAWLGRGNALYELKRSGEAFTACDRALATNPDLAEAWLCRGNILAQLKRRDEAVVAYDRALALQADFAEAWLCRGNILTELKRRDEAAAAYDRALASKPDLAEAWLGRGNIARELKRYGDAFAAYDRLLGLAPDAAEAWAGRGDVLFEVRRYDDASAAYEKALALKPELVEAWVGRGNVLYELKRYDDALVAYDKAVASKPDLGAGWLGRGNILTLLGRPGDAFAAYDRAFTLDSDLDYAASSRLAAKLYLCDWTNWEAEVAQLLAKVRQHNLSSDNLAISGHRLAAGKFALPFVMASLTDDPAILLQCAVDAVDTMRERAAYPTPLPQVERTHSGKIRLGYLSQDLRQHVTGLGFVELFEKHDKSKFELHGFSLSPDDGSAVRKRIAVAFDHFHDVSSVDDESIARRMRQLEIDVVVEMVAHTRGSRPGILAYRPVPVQVNGWSPGYSAGATFIDYILGDPWMLPFTDQPYFLEKIVHLPHTCFPHDSMQAISARTPSRSDEGLPERGFVFCCFNTSYKLTPRFFAVWMNLLRAVDGSVLWLARSNEHVVANLRRNASEMGIDPARLIFAERRAAMEDHLARHRLADLFLDTLPYNAHSTAMDALWAGVPVLTCAGGSYVGRFATSQLHGIGMPEMVAMDIAAYERLALALARDRQRMKDLKAKVERNRLTTPLFDTGRLARELEAAYEIMVDIWRRGESPRNFSIGPM